MAEPICRVKAHGEGITYVCFTAKRQLVTCGDDEEVRVYSDLSGVADGDVEEFSVSSSGVSAVASYCKADGSPSIALGMDDNTVQAFSTEGTSDGLLMRFTAKVTCLSVSSDHTLLGAGSSDFSLKVLDLSSLPAFTSYSLTGHDAPLLDLHFDPRGEFLATTCCDGALRVWSLSGRSVVKSVPVLPKCSDYSLSTTLGKLSWKQDGEMLAVPAGSEVKIYKRGSWDCVHTLTDGSYHTEPLNVVSWCCHGDYLACADTAGRVSIWQISKKKLWKKMKNEGKTGITSLEWDSGTGPSHTNRLVFADKDGHVGMFDVPLPKETAAEKTDPLVDDSLLMEGIPADDIFGDDYDDDDLFSDNLKSSSEGVGVGSKKMEEGGDDVMSMLSGAHSDDGEDAPLPVHLPSKPQGVKFSDKMVEVYQSPWQPSATPSHLQHRFMVYNMVGVVRSHDDEDASLVEVDFHDSGTHHSFSLPNSLDHSMAALTSQALALACPWTDDRPSQIQCVHFGSWDSVKDWLLPLPKKESVEAIAMGANWIAAATNRRHLRVFTVGGVQREVISLPGHVVAMAALGPRLAIVYQTPPCTVGVYSLTVWVLDMQRRKQLVPPHTLPLTPHSQLKWIGFSDEGCLVTHDSKSIVRIHGNSNYGGSSWIPVLDTSGQLNNKSDAYFVVGMTHDPDELRAILCKGMEYPPVQPRPVMSSLSLNMPLCEPQLEKTEHEREYLQDLLLVPPLRPRPSEDLVQKLLKMFALSCKSGRELRAWEIAAMLPDNESMELALTYASRTHRIRLARQINELMQQKALEQDERSDEEEEEEGEELEMGAGLAGSDMYGDHGSDLSRGRRHFHGGAGGGMAGSMRRSDLRRGGMETGSSGSNSRFKLSSRSSEVNSRQRVESSSKAATEIVDQTAELFSDGEEEVAMSDYGGGGEGNGDIESGSDGEVEKREEKDEEVEKENQRELGSPLLDDSCLKRPNPFKVTTPVSKKISMERREGFLQKITARVDEENKMKEAKKLRREKANHVPVKKTKGGSGKAKKSSLPQKTLRGKFLKSKDSSTESASSEKRVEKDAEVCRSPGEGHQNNGGHCSDPEEASEDINGQSETTKLSSSQKLASFAFKTAQH